MTHIIIELLIPLFVLFILSLFIIFLILKLINSLEERGKITIELIVFKMVSLFVKIERTGPCKKIHNKKNK